MGTPLVIAIDRDANGGFPEPLAGEPVRMLAARDPRCGEATRVRVPRPVPTRAVRRVHCVRCGQEFAPDSVEEVAAGGRSGRLALGGLSLPRPPLPPFDPSSPAWRFASVPVAAALVIGGLLLIQGEESEPEGGPAPRGADTGRQRPPSSANALERGGRAGELRRAAREARAVNGARFTLALPAGWEQIDPPAGATFAAVSADRTADATLWIEEKPGLAFPEFISRSLTQIETFTGRPGTVVDRVVAPTPEATVVRLAADAPPGDPSYAVLLRVAGPFRYYLATTLEPDASRAAADGVDLIEGSLTPEAATVPGEGR